MSAAWHEAHIAGSLFSKRLQGTTMKLTHILISAGFWILSSFQGAYAACASDDPVAVAKSFHDKHVQFASENPAKIKTIVTPRFFDALDREFKCAQGEICAIETDPWTDAQDGEVGKPIEFASVSNSGTEAAVSMTYPFTLNKGHHEQKHATILLQRKSPTECWLISDVKGPLDQSLVEDVEAWHKQYGNRP
jgi:hypothetical protein